MRNTQQGTSSPEGEENFTLLHMPPLPLRERVGVRGRCLMDELVNDQSPHLDPLPQRGEEIASRSDVQSGAWFNGPDEWRRCAIALLAQVVV